MDDSQLKISVTITPDLVRDPSFMELMELPIEFYRYNFSYGDFHVNYRFIKELKEEHPLLPLCADLKGPEQRIRFINHSNPYYDIKENTQLVVYVQEEAARAHTGTLFLPMAEDIEEGRVLIINDSQLKCEVIKKENTRVVVKMLNEGRLYPDSSVAVDSSHFSLPPVDREGLERIRSLAPFCDFLMVSFTRNKRDIELIRPCFDGKIIAKIETKEAVEKYREIQEAADATLIARGDLSMVYSLEKLPRVVSGLSPFFKKKEVYLATGFWDGMEQGRTPSFSNYFDLYHAVKQGVKGFLLTSETALGANPVSSVKELMKTLSSYSFK